MASKVKIIEEHGQTVLFECEMDKIEEAYKYAVELEELGIEFKIVTPSLPESLGESLGMSRHDLNQLKLELEEEIDSHNQPCESDSCTMSFSKSKLTH